MTKTENQIMTNKWSLVDHNEKIKQKNNASFKTVDELCEAFQASMKLLT